MIWVILFLIVAGFVYFLLTPRRFQTLENSGAVVDEKFEAHAITETSEDPREVAPLVQAAAKRAANRPIHGGGNDDPTLDRPARTDNEH